MPSLEEYSDSEVEEPVHGDLLVTRRALSIQPKVMEMRNNMSIFFTQDAT